MNNNILLNEAYFGKTPGVLKIEKAIGVLRKKYKGQFKSKEINLDPGIDDICRAIEDAFGFGIVNFEIILDSKINAWTLPIGLSVDARGSKYIELDTTNGYKYNKQADFAAMFFITSGLFLNRAVTDSEVTAIVLHEIGHNFTTSAIDYNNNFNILSNIVFGLSTFGIGTIAFSNISKRTVINAKKYVIDTFKKLAEVVYAFKSALASIKYIIDEFEKTANIVQLCTAPFASIAMVLSEFSKQQIKRTLLFPGKFFAGYDDERFADSFATMYGYGPEMQSGLEKLSDKNNSISVIDNLVLRVPLLANYMELVMLPAMFIIYAFDEHPELPARMKNTCTQIEYDLKNHHYRPEMKARIKHDLKVMQANLAKYKDINTKITENPNAVKQMYYRWLLNNFDGDIKHNIFFATTPEGINNNFFEKIKMKKFK